ncbi:MSC_0619 family F1-like ATPase alpha subunit [Mycoplasma crocodyli]|uniref:ATP synthase alpha/beta family, nucleotide-binding domain protein n=1 Tax=Mycoplasma crocodyli (strain ATCC 51981 / MP145) TaxID=512564 RepID=D5E4T4_MYCCM|nr:ATP F0F1 synthase subunit alpha [Mycoplasma crocodyli]ADE19497.1 ATP synthase alpha/beta family, nucleotide-binding domain protein [Mycoplasma crocodyli MP145]
MNKKIIIIEIHDYIIKVKGNVDFAQNQKFVLAKNKNANAILITANNDEAYLLVSANAGSYEVGDILVPTDDTEVVTTSNNFYGKIIDIHNNIIWPESSFFEQKPEYFGDAKIFGKTHNLMSVKTLNKQLYTGLIMVDLLVPIGKGQREAIIGNRQTGKTHIALNTIINQKTDNVKCIYVAIGAKKQELSLIYKTLKENGALNYTIIVSASANSPYEQYLAPYVGMAHAENISANDDVLIVFDDLTKHANIFREIALLVDKPVGKEAFPGDMFFTHSRLLERSGNFVGRKTITALPIVKIIDNDITSLIASNVISITDGQIVTNSDMYASGKRPAIDINLSVSRTGSSVQSKTLTKISGEMAKIYKAYRRQIKLASLKYELNKEMSVLLNQGKMIETMFNQKGFSYFSPNILLLTTKLIHWNVFKDMKDLQVALKFLDKMIIKDETTKKVFINILSGEINDEDLTKNFFKSLLLDFSNLNNLGWKIKVKSEFLKTDKQIIEEISNQLEVK